MAEWVCAGCGATLQGEFPNQPGYLPAGAEGRPDAVCKRCFRIRHYGEFTPVTVSRQDYETAVRSALGQVDHVLYVVDVFDISGSLVPNAQELLNDRPVIVAVNKVDILPRAVEPDLLSTWIRSELTASGVRVLDVRFVSGQSGAGMDELLTTMTSFDATRWCTLGMANVGKSTLLNRLTSDRRLTTSRMPGTTLGTVASELELPDGRTLTLVDTPGLIDGRRATDVLCADCLKQVVPQSRLRPRVYQLDSGQTLFLGGFARLDFEQGAHQSIVCYVSNELFVHRTKLDNADAFFADHSVDLLQTPCVACSVNLGPLTRHSLATRDIARSPAHAAEVQIPRSGCDLVLAGLGWITLFGARFGGTLHMHSGLAWDTRPRLVGETSRGD